MSFTTWKAISGLTLLSGLLTSTTPAQATPVTFIFDGTSSGGSTGNSRTFSDPSGLSVVARAYYYSTSGDDGFRDASLGLWDNNGLAVCSALDSTCASPNHQVDNSAYETEWVLFLFSQEVDPTRVYLNNSGGGAGDNTDTDMSWYSGRFASGLPNTSFDFNGSGDHSYADLASSPFSSLESGIDLRASGALDRWATLGASTSAVHFLLVGAYNNSSHNNDFFKIWKLDVNTVDPPPDQPLPAPEPASLVLLGTGLVVVARRVRNRRT